MTYAITFSDGFSAYTVNVNGWDDALRLYDAKLADRGIVWLRMVIAKSGELCMTHARDGDGDVDRYESIPANHRR